MMTNYPLLKYNCSRRVRAHSGRARQTIQGFKFERNRGETVIKATLIGSLGREVENFLRSTIRHPSQQKQEY